MARKTGSRPKTSRRASRDKPLIRRKLKRINALPKAGRPTATRVEAINRAILDAARQHFLGSGFDATGMEAIAATAGVSKGTLYARYPSKEALLRAVVEEQCAIWTREAGQRHGPPAGDFKQRLRHRARALIESIASEEIRGFEKLVGGSSLPTGEVARALFAAGYQPAINELTAEIIAGTLKQPVPPRNPARVAEMLLGTLFSWYRAHEIVREVSIEEARNYCDHAVEVIFAGRSAW